MRPKKRKSAGQPRISKTGETVISKTLLLFYQIVPKSQTGGEPPINWLLRQVEADQRLELSINAGDDQAAKIARNEREYAAEHHNGTAIFGERIFDNPQGAA